MQLLYFLDLLHKTVQQANKIKSLMKIVFKICFIVVMTCPSYMTVMLRLTGHAEGFFILPSRLLSI
jgi:hypothetical protein